MALALIRYVIHSAKLVCVDVKATDSLGRVFVIEVQIVV